MAEEEEVMVWRPPLHLALRRILNKEEEDLAVLRLLLTHHADPNRRDLRGRTALEAAIEWGCSQEAVEALREASESAATPVVVRKAADVPQERWCGRLGEQPQQSGSRWAWPPGLEQDSRVTRWAWPPGL